MAADPNTRDDTVQKPALQADRTWYNSLFTQLIGPLIATRYGWLAIEEINPRNFLGKEAPKVQGPAWKEPSLGRYASRNFAAFGMGAVFMSIIGLYSKNTLHDIKSVYAESVGYELGKKPEEVSYTDLMRSENAALAVTRNAYLRRTLLRMGTAATFFLPWHKLRDQAFASRKPKYDVNANVGVGATGVHLFAEGFMREPSFFDIEQKIISSKINHKDVYSYASITSGDIQSLLNLQARHLNADYTPADGASQDGQHYIRLCDRIAELLNETYHNTPRKEEANFTIGKFNFLLGFNMLYRFPESLAFVEMANRSADMQDVKQARAAILSGQDPQAVFARAGIDMQALARPEAKAPDAQEHGASSPHADKVTARTHQPRTLYEHSAHTAQEHARV